MITIRDDIDISILIPAYNEENNIMRCLTNMIALTSPIVKYEIIVINDGSVDRTKDMVDRFKKKYPKTILINKENGGRGSALNAGLKMAKGEFILALDADTFPNENYLHGILKPFNDKSIGIVGGHHYAVNNRKFIEKVQHSRYIGVYGYSNWGKKKISSGTGTAYRKKALIEVGGFAQGTFHVSGVTAKRIVARGWKMVYNPKVKIGVIVEDNFVSFIKQKLVWRRPDKVDTPEEVSFDFLGNFFTHGFSLILFFSIIITSILLILDSDLFIFSMIFTPISILVDFSRFAPIAVKMGRNSEHRQYCIYMIFNAFIEQIVRFVSIPYIVSYKAKNFRNK